MSTDRRTRAWEIAIASAIFLAWAYQIARLAQRVQM